MIVLGIETSCDETAAAVWRHDRLAANVVASQEVHRQFGGVVPELASRAHVKLIVPIVQSALDKAGIAANQLDGIAVTYGPGLAGSLLVGLNFAKAMSLGLGKPFVGVNHLEGHIFSNSVVAEGPEPPFVALIVSGGHTQLVLVKSWGDYEIVGKTRDDAVGEAFDKVAKMLDLPYPGGPAIDKLAQKGDADYVRFPRAQFKDASLDFSYSGLKTAVLYSLQSLSAEQRRQTRAHIAASFQAAAVAVLVDNSLAALKRRAIDQLVLAGGVASNSLLRQRLAAASQTLGFQLFIPPPDLCTDNGAMIAKAGAFYLAQGNSSEFSLSPRPALTLA
ncbi:MAG: tRNA (adenosine(37)-N6)-threonylcarbamoyltransferase complex transferase subunit TsaD [bacterium]